MRIDEPRKWYKKYPDIYDGYQISLKFLGQHLEIYNHLKNNLKELKILGLEDFGVDIKSICDPNWLKKERREKLKKIKKVCKRKN